MHIVSVITLLVGSIFAYSVAAPQFGGGYYPVNIAGLSAALAQLAQQLAAQGNTTVTVGNSSSIVSGVSSSIANAHIEGDRRPGQHHHNHGSWNNNNGWGYWRDGGELYDENDMQDSEEIAALEGLKHEDELELERLQNEEEIELAGGKPEDEEDADYKDDNEKEHLKF